MKELAGLAEPRVVPPLQQRFTPAALANHAYLKAVQGSGRAQPLVIGLEGHGGNFSVFKTQCFEEGSRSASLNFSFSERLVKMLLWQKGGWRVVVGGPRSSPSPLLTI